MYEVINHGTPRSIQTRLEITAPSADNRRSALSASLRGLIAPVEKVAPQENGVNLELDGVEGSLTLGGNNFGRETSRIRAEHMRVRKKVKHFKKMAQNVFGKVVTNLNHLNYIRVHNT